MIRKAPCNSFTIKALASSSTMPTWTKGPRPQQPQVMCKVARADQGKTRCAMRLRQSQALQEDGTLGGIPGSNAIPHLSEPTSL